MYPVRPAHMTPERFDRIRAVYEAAVDAPAASRQRVLKRECSGDDELRQEVETLLGAREHLPEWLSGPCVHQSATDKLTAHRRATRSASARWGLGPVGENRVYQVASACGSYLP